MSLPNDRRYSKSHEWHKPEGPLVVIGITQHAVDELTDVTYMGYTKSRGPIKAGEAFGEVESVKATSEVYSGIDGEIVETNPALADNPSLLNDDCYGRGWMLKLKPADPAQLQSLLSPDDYARQYA
jgi:glycine cleavage system H protein